MQPDSPRHLHPPPRWRPALLAKGFRVFFLLAAAQAMLLVPLWVAIHAGLVPPPAWLDPVQWHAHEMLFGYAAAVLAGFLLTAVSNWTKRVTAVGPALAALASLWLAGRIAVALPGLPAALVAALDLAFFPALAVALTRPIVAARSRRNYIFPVLLAAFFLANLMVHLDALGALAGGRRRGHILAVDLVVMVILVITGRIVPLFTRSAAQASDVRSSPWLDRATLLTMGCVALLDGALPGTSATPFVAGAAGALCLLRARRWGARHALREPLLWVLHLGHAWVAVGLLLRCASVLTPSVSPQAALHALTAGAIGTLTLGMMARVTLGHTGRALQASRALGLSFVLISAAALLRVGGALWLQPHYGTVLAVSGALWSGAFALYLLSLGPALVSARPDGRSG